MIIRPATNEEIAAEFASSIEFGYAVKFRHLALEIYRPSAENGVAHRYHSNSKVRVTADGVFVRHHGKLRRVAASHVDLGDGVRPFVTDLRLEGLPGEI